MLRIILKAVLADFCRETGLSSLRHSVAWEEDLPPSKPATALPAVCELRNCQSTVPSWLQRISWTRTSLCFHTLLGKAKDVFQDSQCTQNNFTWHGKSEQDLVKKKNNLKGLSNNCWGLKLKKTTCQDKLCGKSKDNVLYNMKPNCGWRQQSQ